MGTDITLKCSSINSGNAVSIKGAEITYSIQANLGIPNIIAKYAATEAQSTVDYLGNQNPLITINGLLDTNDSSSNILTFALLKSFAMEKTNVIYITDDKFFPTANTSKVKIISFDIKRIAKENDGRYLRYSINLVETL